MRPGTLTIMHGKIKVVAGEPISVEGLTTDDVQVLKQKTFDKMLEIYQTNSGT